jgi:hypothetical protein
MKQEPTNQPGQDDIDWNEIEPETTAIYAGRIGTDFIQDNNPVLTIIIDPKWSDSTPEAIRQKWGGTNPTVEDLVFDAGEVPDNEENPWQYLAGKRISIMVEFWAGPSNDSNSS